MRHDFGDNPAARNNPNTVRSIKAVQRGTTLAAAYKIVASDATGGVGTFFAQCGQTLRQADFHVTLDVLPALPAA